MIHPADLGRRIVLVLAIGLALTGCYPLATPFPERSDQYSDGIGHNFHKWRGYN